MPSATRLAGRLGYPNVMRGPKRLDKPQPRPERAAREFRKQRRLTKGERLFILTGSGLVAATDLAVVRTVNQPFGRHSCAGYDCLANKGVMLIEIAIPGMPEPLFVLNTHLNSRRAPLVGLSARALSAGGVHVHTLMIGRVSDFSVAFCRHADSTLSISTDDRLGSARAHCSVLDDEMDRLLVANNAVRWPEAVFMA